jgi:hypothetical protein
MVKKQSEEEFHLYFVSNKNHILRLSINFVEIIRITAQFGPWSYGPQHGFARIMRWTLEKAPERLPSGDVEAVFSIMDNEFTRSMWNYP